MADLRTATLALNTAGFRAFNGDAFDADLDPGYRLVGQAAFDRRVAAGNQVINLDPPEGRRVGAWMVKRMLDRVSDTAKMWHDGDLYLAVDGGEHWATFGPESIEAWPLWPFDLLAEFSVDDPPDGEASTRSDGEGRTLRHLSGRVDLAAAGHREPRLLVAGTIKAAIVGELPVHVWLDDNEVVHRVAVTLDGREWEICELFEHGTADPAIDEARVVRPTEVERWPWEGRRRWYRRLPMPPGTRRSAPDSADEQP